MNFGVFLVKKDKNSFRIGFQNIDGFPTNRTNVMENIA
jgi:hypothetical protein